MAPKGLAIILGAGPTTGAGIARVLSSPHQGNMAVALLARRAEPLTELATALRLSNPGAVLETFPTISSSSETSSSSSPAEQLRKVFGEIRRHESFRGLTLDLAVFSIKNSAKKPFLEETVEGFMGTLEDYVGGAVVFSQEALKLMFEQHGEQTLAEGGSKKGTLIFTGTLGALRCNAEYGSYGASRGSVRQLAQALAREMSARGVHVVHTIANGRISDASADTPEVQSGKHIAAEAVGETYLYLHNQHPTLWTHELDMRPAQEKF